MSLNSFRVNPQIAVSDMTRAGAFYEGKLGLARVGPEHKGSRGYACGDGTILYVYESPAHAGKSGSTLARWDVAGSIEEAVDALSAKGVTFEHYDEPVRTNAKGIHDSGYGKVAWFKDPDGNTFALEQC
jgi:catechol 2,3-dioxygenase-like lactoylglutathione lyase family enzyme